MKFSGLGSFGVGRFSPLRVTHLLVSFLLFIGQSPARAKSLGDPGEGGGMGNEIGPNSGTALRSNGLINPLTGQPNYWMNLLTLKSKTGFDVTVDLHYGQNVSSEAERDNNFAPTGWCGLGWHLGYSTIWVAHQGTVSDDDDR